MPIAFAADVVDCLEFLREGAGERRVDFSFRPDVIFAFLAFGIGIEADAKPCPSTIMSRSSQLDGLFDARAIERQARVAARSSVRTSMNCALS